MPNLTDQGVCIRHWDFSETSQTVSIFTRGHGVLRGLAKGSKRQKGAFSGGIDLLTRGELGAIVKPNRDLATLTAWHLERVYWSLRRSLEANRAGMYMADLVHRMVSPQDPHPRLFDVMCDQLARLDGGTGAQTALLVFQWVLLDEAGYRPELSRDAETGHDLDGSAETLAFSPRAGGVVADTGRGGRWRVRRETIDVLRTLARGAEPPAPAPRANHLLAAYIREILGEQPAAMRWAFPDLPVAP